MLQRELFSMFFLGNDYNKGLRTRGGGGEGTMGRCPCTFCAIEKCPLPKMKIRHLKAVDKLVDANQFA